MESTCSTDLALILAIFNKTVECAGKTAYTHRKRIVGNDIDLCRRVAESHASLVAAEQAANIVENVISALRVVADGNVSACDKIVIYSAGIVAVADNTAYIALMASYDNILDIVNEIAVELCTDNVICSASNGSDIGLLGLGIYGEGFCSVLAVLHGRLRLHRRIPYQDLR